MTLNIGKEVSNLKRMSVGQLRERYEAVYQEACRTNNRAWLIKRIAWRLQANAEGDLSERAKKRAVEIANDADLRLNPPRHNKNDVLPVNVVQGTLDSKRDPRLPMPGAVLTRDYKGETIEVKVLADGFEFEGEEYKSLSAVAKHITATHTSGFLFFGLNGKVK